QNPTESHRPMGSSQGLRAQSGLTTGAVSFQWKRGWGNAEGRSRSQYEFRLCCEEYPPAVGGVSMDGELSGQVVIVTGAGRGIGRAVVTELAGAGARLVMVARTRADL